MRPIFDLTRFVIRTADDRVISFAHALTSLMNASVVGEPDSVSACYTTCLSFFDLGGLEEWKLGRVSRFAPLVLDLLATDAYRYGPRWLATLMPLIEGIAAGNPEIEEKAAALRHALDG